MKNKYNKAYYNFAVNYSFTFNFQPLRYVQVEAKFVIFMVLVSQGMVSTLKTGEVGNENTIR